MSSNFSVRAIVSPPSLGTISPVMNAPNIQEYPLELKTAVQRRLQNRITTEDRTYQRSHGHQ